MKTKEVRILTVLLAVLCGLFNSASLFADAQSHLQTAVSIQRERAVLKYARLYSALRAGYDTGSVSPTLLPRYNDLLVDLRDIKSEIEAAATELGDADFTPMVGVMLDYYSLQYLLYVASHVLQHRVAAVNTDAIQQLLLVVPMTQARQLQERMSRAAIERQIEPYNIGIRVIPVPNDATHATIDLAMEMRRRFLLQSFAFFPSESLAIDTLRMAGFNQLFTHIANIESYLHADEKVTVNVPSSVQREDLAFLTLMQEEAYRVVDEGNYRPAFRERVVPALSGLVSMRSLPPLQPGERPRPSPYHADLRAFLNSSLTTYASHLRPDIRANLELQGRMRAQGRMQAQVRTLEENLAQHLGQVIVAFHQVRRDSLSQRIRQEIERSPQFYHLYEGEALVHLLKEMAKSHEKALLRFTLSCGIFADTLQGRSRCASSDPNAPAPIAIDTRAGWTQAEIDQFEAQLETLVERQYAAVPQNLIDELARSRQSIHEEGVARRRYRIGTLLIEGARRVERMERIFAAINSAEQNHTVVHDDVLNDPEVMAGEILPGRVILAASSVNYLRNPESPVIVKPWVSEILSAYMAQITERQGDRARLLQHGQALGVLPQNESAPASQRVATLIEQVSSPVEVIAQAAFQNFDLPQEERARGRIGNRDCSGFLGFLNCIDVFVDRIRAFQDSVAQRLAGRSGVNISTAPRYDIPRNGPLAELWGIYQNQEQMPGQNWASIDARLEDMKNILTRGMTGVRSESVQFIEAFQTLLHFADEHTSRPLMRQQIEEIFQELFRMRQTVNIMPLVVFVADLEAFQHLVRDPGPFHELLMTMYQPAEMRDRDLRAVLHNSQILREYIKLMLQDLEDRLPALFFEMRMPTALRAQIENERGIPLYRVINGLRDQAHQPALVAALMPILSSVTAESQTQENVEQQLQAIPESLLRQLLAGAVVQTRASHDLWETIWRRFLGIVEGPAEDSWWPTELKARDVMPALRDHLFLDGCQNTVHAAYCERNTKVHRVLVNAFLKPYFMSAATADKNAVELLASPRREDQVRALTQSTALSGLVRSIGGRVQSGLARIAAQTLSRDETLSSISETLRSANEGVFNAFMTSQMTGLSSLMSATIHSVTSWAMFVPVVGELVVNGMLSNQYHLNYLALQPFASSGMLRGGLVESRELQRVSERFVSHLTQVRDGLPNTIIWGTGLISGQFAARNQAPGVGGESVGGGARRGGGGAGFGVARRATRVDYQLLGLDPERTYTEEELNAHWRVRARQLHPDARENRGNRHATADFQRANEARRRILADIENGATPVFVDEDNAGNEATGPRTYTDAERSAPPVAEDYRTLQVSPSETDPAVVRGAFIRRSALVTGDSSAAQENRARLQLAFDRVMADLTRRQERSAAANTGIRGAMRRAANAIQNAFRRVTGRGRGAAASGSGNPGAVIGPSRRLMPPARGLPASTDHHQD